MLSERRKAMGKLYDQMKVDLELKNLSPRTRSCYLTWVKSFALHFLRSPEEMGDPEIREYLHYLTQGKKASQSGVSQAYSAFFYETTLKRDWKGYGSPGRRERNFRWFFLSRRFRLFFPPFGI
jgi:hypothetical protein